MPPAGSFKGDKGKQNEALAKQVSQPPPHLSSVISVAQCPLPSQSLKAAVWYTVTKVFP